MSRKRVNRHLKGAIQPWIPVAGLILLILAMLARMILYSPPPIKNGAFAPDILLSNPGEPPVHLSDKRGKVVILDFWATWCGPCRQSMPHLSQVYENYKADGVEVYGISVDSPEGRNQVPSTVKALNVTYPILFALDQPDVQELYKAHSLPTMVIINKKGEIVKYESGFDPSLDLDALIGDLQKEK